jgi:hypothetical protein
VNWSGVIFENVCFARIPMMNLRILRVTKTERPSPTTNCSDESPKVKILRWGQCHASSRWQR